MNTEEALHICRLAKAASPAQAVDEYTPELWALVLKPYRYVDAEQALTDLAGEQEWIHVSHIRRRIKRIRHDRVMAYGLLPDPPKELDPSNTTAYHHWMVELTRQIADGEVTAADRPKELLQRRPEDPRAAAALKQLRDDWNAGVRTGDLEDA